MVITKFKNRLVPSPLYSGETRADSAAARERVRVRGGVPNQHGSPTRAARAKPLTPALSPEYRGEGERILPGGKVTRLVVGVLCAGLLLLSVGVPTARAQEPGGISKNELAREAEYYKIIPIPIPKDIVLEAVGMEMLPDGKLLVGTRRGDVYMVENAYDDPPTNAKFTRWASGLHEAMGLSYNPNDGYVYCIQRGEITKLKDAHNTGRCDTYETYCDGWALSGDYHEFDFLSKFDPEGNLYCVLTLTGSFTSNVPWRGWCMKITPDGKMHPFASGIRSPGGIAFDCEGNLLYSDNQGPWNGTSSVKLLKQGAFEGHTEGNKWYSLPLAREEMGPRPKDPQTKSRIWIEAQKIPEFIPPPLWLPHAKIGQSTSGIFCDRSDGKLGPFAHQLFIGDQHHSNIVRGVMEKVNGRYQGVIIPLRYGFSSGIVPMIQAPDGSVFVGGTNRGWGAVGPKEFALERMVWTGKTPFEMYDMKVQPDGFVITFTEPVDKATAGDVKNYDLKTFSYIYQADYGSPEVDQTTPTVKSATVADDGKSVRLVVDGLKIGSIHELHVPKLRSAQGDKPVVHPVAYYTLWNIPGQGGGGDKDSKQSK
jgi:hypothetical protein